jgi:hypothetical protein
MPDPDRLLTTLHRAVQAFRETPGRRGRFVELRDASDVLVGGDLHGNIENFRLLMQKADLAKNPRRHFVVQELVHGPFRYPAGGDKSHQLLDLVAALKCQYPGRVHVLLGNHELAQWKSQWIAKAEQDLNDVFRAGVAAAYAPRDDEVYAAYHALFAIVPLALRTRNRVFLSHSLPSALRMASFDFGALQKEENDDADLAPGGSVHALVWGRDTSPPNVRAFLEKVDADLLITGHIPCERGFEAPNDRQIILDAMQTPACYCLFPAERAITHEELIRCVAEL